MILDNFSPQNFSAIWCLLCHKLFTAVAACLPFLPPKNGYYVHDIQQTYYPPTNLLQIGCKNGYNLISLGSESSNGMAECQDGIWNDTFFCESNVIV